jgi:TolB-like protein/DNA-binding winged helix-turn-helix (wHTH) protein
MLRSSATLLIMDKATQTGKVVRFGAYDVDLVGRELRKGGIRIKLQPKPFQVLTILLQHAGKSISRDELKKLLWAPDTFVDFDHGLNTAINKIREALNDSAENPRFIETLPSGYRFIGAVNGHVPSPGIEILVPSKQDPTSARIPRWQLRWGLGTIIAICFVVVSLLTFHYKTGIFSRHPSNIKSIAVLPLRNLSGDPAQDYFSDSLTDELTTQLAKIISLRVASAASVLRYKNTNVRASEIGRDLKVDAFVEGSVLRSNDKVRITAQLIDVATDRHIWAEEYHGEMRDILVLQSNFASAIATKVQAGIAPSDTRKLTQPHRVDPRAYDAYLKGRGHWFRSKMFGAEPNDLEKSSEEFRQAIQYDPSFAPAYAGLANYYGLMAGSGGIAAKDGWKLSEESAKKALALDECSAEAHSALATKLMFYDWDWAGTEREIQLGMECDPHYAELYNVKTQFLAYMGRFDESIAAARRAEELDPLSQRFCVQKALRFSRRFDEFLLEVENVFNSEPAHIHEQRAYVHKARKQYAQEVEETDKMFRFEGCIPCAERLAKAYVRGGYRGWLEAKLADLKKRSGQEYGSPLENAQIYASLGNADMAMQYLEAAYREHTGMLVRLQVDAAYDGLHSDPRFQDLIRRIGLPLSAANP